MSSDKTHYLAVATIAVLGTAIVSCLMFGNTPARYDNVASVTQVNTIALAETKNELEHTKIELVVMTHIMDDLPYPVWAKKLL